MNAPKTYFVTRTTQWPGKVVVAKTLHPHASSKIVMVLNDTVENEIKCLAFALVRNATQREAA